MDFDCTLHCAYLHEEIDFETSVSIICFAAIIWCLWILVCFRLMTLCESSGIVLVGEDVPNACVCLSVCVCACVSDYVGSGRKRWISEQRTGALPARETPAHCRWAKPPSIHMELFMVGRRHAPTVSVSVRIYALLHVYAYCNSLAVSINRYWAISEAWLNINLNLLSQQPWFYYEV